MKSVLVTILISLLSLYFRSVICTTNGSIVVVRSMLGIHHTLTNYNYETQCSLLLNLQEAVSYIPSLSVVSASSLIQVPSLWQNSFRCLLNVFIVNLWLQWGHSWRFRGIESLVFFFLDSAIRAARRPLEDLSSDSMDLA